MSEQQVERASNTSAAPALKLVFDGLFFFCFNDGGTPRQPAVADPAAECRVGFITTAPRHLLTISGQQTSVNGGLKVFSGFDVTLTHGQARKMLIDLDVPGVPARSVRRRGYDPAFNRRADPSPPDDSFQWIIDLENSDLHNTKLPLLPGVLNPVMHINIGEFYTEDLSLVDYFHTKLGQDPPREAEPNFGKAAVRTGVIINTLPEGKAFLKLGAATLPLVAEAGLTFEVTFRNHCPSCDIANDEVEDLHLSDFPLHYHAFDVKALDQFDLDFRGSTAFPPAICYAASGSRTTDI